MTKIQHVTTNVYKDLGLDNAEEMLIKAKLASQINHLIIKNKLTQIKASKMLGITQPKLSGMLRGQFRGISETKMLDCLTRLGQDVQIIVKPTPRSRSEGHVSVTFD
jgi:predicted XRE-type DNA-binding protein